MHETMMKFVLLQQTLSLNDRSKLKGQYTDVKNGCVTSVGPCLNPQSVSKNSRATVPFIRLVTANLIKGSCLGGLII